MNWNQTLERVLANRKSLTPGKVLLTLITLPFLLVGWIVGLVWLVGTVVWSAVWVGAQQARDLARGNDGG